MRKVTLLYFEGCSNWEVADERLRQLAGEYGLTLARRRVDTPEQAEREGFSGSPTVLVDGVDPFATGDQPSGLACRIYADEEGPQGAPSLEQLRAVLA